MNPHLPILLALLLPAFSGAALDLPKRSVSSSGQFIIYSNDATVRSKTAIKAEDLKSTFLDTLRIKDEWKTPIILNLGSPAPVTKRPPRALLGIYEGDNGQAKIQLDVFDLTLLKEPEFDSQLLGAILLEFAYRGTPLRAGRPYLRPPAWVLAGLTERLRIRDNGPNAGLYATLLSSANPPRLGDFLDAQPDRLDATSRALYQAQAAALLEAVLALPDGRKGLRDYLAAPRRTPTSTGELASLFPAAGRDATSLSRKWVLAIARASASDRIDLLGERETARQLTDILDVKALPDPKHPEVASMSGPYALPSIARSQNGRFILSQTESALLQLSLRAHPLYKPIVDEYLGITRDLVAKPKRRLDKRIAAAEEIRAGLTRRTSESRDYLDWIEATKIKTESPELNNTIRDLDDLEQPPARTDAISNYLDSVSERSQ